MAAHAGVLLTTYPADPIFSFAHRLLTESDSDMTLSEFVCATHVLTGVEAGQCQLAKQFLPAIDAVDLAKIHEVVRLLLNLRVHLARIRAHPALRPGQCEPSAAAPVPHSF